MPACTEPGGKECSTRRKTGALSDAQWIACQHEAWANELIATHLASEGVGWALAHDIDPASGQAPRHRERWPVIAERLACERRQLDSAPRERVGGLRELLWREGGKTIRCVHCSARTRRPGKSCAPAQRDPFEA